MKAKEDILILSIVTSLLLKLRGKGQEFLSDVEIHPALLRLSAIISQYFTAAGSASFVLHTTMTK
jgi:hypothetical protein